MPIAAIVLEVVEGPERGRTVRISEFGPILLGRGIDVDIRLPATDPTLSRHQAYIELTPDGCVLTRVKGSNHVVEVNDSSVDLRCKLADGDVVRFGSTLVRIGLMLTDRTCVLCSKGMENADSLERDEHADISVQAHEHCIHALNPGGESIAGYEACRLLDPIVSDLYQVFERPTRRIWTLRRLPSVTQSRLFECDLQQLLAFRHPNIIRCIRGNVDESGQPFLVMEYARAGRIDHFIGSGRQRTAVALKLFEDVLEALKFLHAAGCAHSNLHPGSIVIQREACGSGSRRVAKLVDPGTANRLRNDIPSPATLRWYPPERLAGQMAQGDDLFATGAILQFLIARQSGDQAPVAARNPTIPPPIASILDRACHKDPAKRFRSAQQLQDALRETSPYF